MNLPRYLLSGNQGMSIRIALSMLSILTLTGIFLVPVSGCARSVTGSADVTPPSTKPALPLLDTETHGPVETAYFALG